jgi:hypothetical protein
MRLTRVAEIQDIADGDYIPSGAACIGYRWNSQNDYQSNNKFPHYCFLLGRVKRRPNTPRNNITMPISPPFIS